jgi:hypothetical protein
MTSTNPPPTRTPTVMPTVTPSPTPGIVEIIRENVPRLQIYQSPNGPVIGQVRPGQVLTLLAGRQELGGLVWVEIVDGEGRLGWIPEIYLQVVTATPIE